MQLDEVLDRLRALSNPEAVRDMARFGINPDKTLGISIPNLRMLAKAIGRDHSLALGLWGSGIHEARILASMIDQPQLVNETQADQWVSQFDSWDVCDQCIMNLLEDTPFAWDKAMEWSASQEEFIKRAGYVMMARLAVSDKGAPDHRFLEFLPRIKEGSLDNRNFVKKAVNWALRQIGKRNITLNIEALKAAQELRELPQPSAKWIATDAIRELAGEAVQKRLRR